MKISLKHEFAFFYDAFMKYSTFFGSVVFWTYAVIILLVLNQQSFAMKFALASVISMAIEHAIKLVYRTRRPDFADIKTPSIYERFQENTSFPSGHSAIMMLFTTMIQIKYDIISLTVFFIAVTLFSGMSRIYMKRHTLKDVLVGYLIGFVIGNVI